MGSMRYASRLIVGIAVMISGCVSFMDDVQLAAKLDAESKLAYVNADINLAISLIDSAISLNSLKPEYYQTYGLLLSKQQHPGPAISMFQQAIEKGAPVSVDGLIRIADEYGKYADQLRLDGGDYQTICREGMKYIDEMFQDYPNPGGRYTCLGTCYFALGVVDTAEIFFKAAIETDTTSLVNYHKLAHLYFSTLRLEDALITFQRALKISQTDRIAIRGIAIINSLESAFSYYRQDPKDQTAVAELIDELVKATRLVGKVGLPYQGIWEDELWIHLYEIYMSD